ncbi:hypothetical protein OG824_13415 [Streptomyces prunicolor]|uniref:hypothetical protein n=1 Tax=Streptomyces prunicolor TaxID=67348 RepID=UPI00225659F5|nr:hypothetical protein [Streptomyces prunicolor]MCX5236201.1 hypothetical protein [Streptomyces prunicolor]
MTCNKTVDWRPCECGVKRGFISRTEADKAMGRAQAKRTRRADAAGTRRGLKVERRTYVCDFGMWHLTSENRSTYENRAPSHQRV